MLSYLLLNFRLVPDPKRQLFLTFKTLYAPKDDRLVYFEKLWKLKKGDYKMI